MIKNNEEQDEESSTAILAGSPCNQEVVVTLHEVWDYNLREEFDRMLKFIDDYPFVAMDTEFPGVVVNPPGGFRNKQDFNYRQLHCNVNVLKMIQVGFTLVDGHGFLPPNKDIWQFNFHFDLDHDQFSDASIELLKSAGFDFDKHRNEGISMMDFGELLTISGLLADKRVNWITFHSSFDFGYLIKSVLVEDLSEDENEFFRCHEVLFPTSFDIRMMLKQPGPIAAKLTGSLQDVANQLQVPRIGQRHQAGSDSLLTAMTFFKLKERFFSDCWENNIAEKVKGLMYGLGS